MSTTNKFYVVMAGRIPGIYRTWAECEFQIKGFPNAKCQSFKTFDEAHIAFNRNDDSIGSPSLKPIMDSYCVDGACSGNPGPISYQCVNTQTREVLFSQSFEGDGTNNISEFLAIVSGLAFFKKQCIQQPIYSDSATAIEWVRQKRCNTTLKMNGTNATLISVIAQAEKWLNENTYTNQVFKWATHLWGEIPADFGRK